ncbi:MAG TPA: hypothetical protein VH853_10605 [Polyangia bacterium]|nr:hypothetical protein [Polyangia bacterium]
MRRLPGSLLLFGAAAAAAGCGPSASPESGITALLRVANAQFVEGALAPDSSATGTAVISGVAINNTTVYPGEQSFPLSGTVTGATALVGLKNDVGYWIVPAPLPDLTTTGGYDFTTQLTFSPLMPIGSQTLILRGVAPDGTVGPAQLYTLASGFPLPPPGPLVITLEWDTESDLDLHVVIPNVDDPTTPIEIWAKHPVGLPVPMLGVPPPDPSVIATAPTLDADSNANCVIDGRRQENVLFPPMSTPPPGDYTVRVDTPSLCGQPDAEWQVTATLTDATGASTLIDFAEWEATDADTRGSHTAGSGRLAFKFTIPTP